jgi:hypothetical protein
VKETAQMASTTAHYWAVIYTAPGSTDPMISLPVRATSAQEAHNRVTNLKMNRVAVNVAGPFGSPAETETYRLAWMREQRAAAKPTRQRTIADLLTETASVIHTNALRDREDRTPAQNAALPPVVTLYGAFNIVICGNPDDTRGSRDGVNSADLVRTFGAFLDQGSALEWSQAPERTHAEIMNALHACASALRDAADRGNIPAELTGNISAALVGDTFVGPRVLVHIGDVLKHRDMENTLTVVGRIPDGRGFLLASDPEVGTPFPWDNYELPGNAGSPFTLVTCPHLDANADVFDLLDRSGVDLDDPALSGMDAFDVAEALSLSADDPAGIAGTVVHEVLPDGSERNTTDLAVSAYPPVPVADGTAWIVTAESFEGSDAGAQMPAETLINISDMDALIKMHRAAGASVEVSWPFGSDGTSSPTYVHVYVDGRGVTSFRRANPDEINTPHTATQTEQDAIDAETYRDLREILRDSMDDPDVWDGEEAEGWIMASYVKWLAAGRPVDEDGYPIRRETYPQTGATLVGAAGVVSDDPAVFLERQNRALEAYRSRMAQEISITLDRIKTRGDDASVTGAEVGRWLTDVKTLAEREYDRQMKL